MFIACCGAFPRERLGLEDGDCFGEDVREALPDIRRHSEIVTSKAQHISIQIMQRFNYIIILPNIALLVCLVQDLLPSGKHVLQALVIDHAPNFVVA